MRSGTIRAWAFVHKWTSLVSTVFLLMLCITGLPLIFHDEIDAALNPDTWRPAHPEGRRLPLDDILAAALSARPGDVPIYMSFDIDRPVVNVTTGPRADAPVPDMHFASFDATSGALVPPADRGETVMEFILRLHTDMFLGLPGMLFLGLMGVFLVAAIVSGAVLYAPFMRRLDFGTVRTGKSARIKWLDMHNLLGIATTGWFVLVGLTGVINTLEAPIIDAWRETALADLIDGLGAGTPPVATALLDAAVDSARRAAGDMELQFVAFPGSDFSTGQHYAIFFHGRTPATERIITPVLVSVTDGTSSGLRDMPWFVQALSLSRPLHFGDYGGLPLKLIWAVLDIMAIVILVTGLYLWIGKQSPDFIREKRAGALERA